MELSKFMVWEFPFFDRINRIVRINKNPVNPVNPVKKSLAVGG